MELRHRVYLSFLVAILAALTFTWWADEVSTGRSANFDRAVRDAVHACSSPMLTEAMRGITLLGSTVIVVLIGGVLAVRLVRAGRRGTAIILGVMVLGAESIDQILKALFHRQRPDVFFGLHQPDSYSFPSGHSVVSCCFYGALAVLLAARVHSPFGKTMVWLGGGAMAGAVGLSRIYLGVHYPSDVVGGYLVAVSWLAVVRAATLTVWEHGRHRKDPATE